jgi:hemerythrin-like domain-containing protein
MAVILGAKPGHGFDEPLGLLSDCHRRIEGFLGVMTRVVERSRCGPLCSEGRAALEGALRYFETAAPRHTEDEEYSLFPRMRNSADPAARAAVAHIDALESDHRRAESLHDEVQRWCRLWLDTGPLEPSQAQRLQQLLVELRAIYARHIAVEDAEVFPVAARTLTPEDLEHVGSEMARRRGLQARGGQ